MPLPAALLARLQKRGIVKKADEPDPDEEIIAEDYDEDQGTAKFYAVRPTQAKPLKSGGVPGCPNKSNPYHKCSLYCFERWGGGATMDRLDADTERRRKRMLKKYPLPSGWEEVFSSEHSRHYYWNTATDDVSWLSPTHPRAVITKSATKPGITGQEVRTSANSAKRARSPSPPSSRRTASDNDEDEVSVGAEGTDDDDLSEEDSEERSEEEEAPEEENEDRALGREGNRSRGRGGDRGFGGRGGRGRRVESSGRSSKKSKDNELDPMDPASYSDVAPGKWSAGLETGDDAKTGVDATASGPLFQMRPYPAPGAILRRNADAKKPAPGSKSKKRR